jgi:hypothetical protein
MELKLCSGNQIANGWMDRRTDARGYNIKCYFSIMGLEKKYTGMTNTEKQKKVCG